MFTALWCLFIIIGAWTTLRHTAFYTRKPAARTLLLMSLMLCAETAAVFLTMRLVDGRSASVQTTAVASVVILSTLGLIFGVAKTAPAGALLTTALPRNAPLVKLYRRRILPWVWAVLICLAGTLLLMRVPGTVQVIATCLAVIVASFVVFGLPAAYVSALRLDRAVTGLQLNPWLHWPPDIYFGQDGVFCNGEFCAWGVAGVSLLSASVEPGPPRRIELWFQKTQMGGYGSTQVMKIRKDVLIPPAAAATDLPALQAALITRCPDATINLA
jgi:hypothetical protein